MSTTLDTTKFRRQIDNCKRAGPEGRKAAVLALAEEVVSSLEIMWPRDTNKSMNGWKAAGNAAGLRTRMLLPINRSSRHDLYVAALSEQMAQAQREYMRWDRMDKLYQSQNRTREPYYRKIQRFKRAAAKRIDKAAEQLRLVNESEGVIFMDRGGYLYGDRRFLKSGYLQRLSTVRTKVYGGSARRIEAGSQTFIELTNHEPHAKMVERVARHGHPLRQAIAHARSLGGRRITQAYLKKMRAAGITLVVPE